MTDHIFPVPAMPTHRVLDPEVIPAGTPFLTVRRKGECTFLRHGLEWDLPLEDRLPTDRTTYYTYEPIPTPNPLPTERGAVVRVIDKASIWVAVCLGGDMWWSDSGVKYNSEQLTNLLRRYDREHVEVSITNGWDRVEL